MAVITEIMANPVARGLVGVLVVVAFISLNVLFLTWMERKVVARVQVRYGPNRAGPFGLLQPVADTVKLLTKEDIIPKAADRLLFTLAPAVAFTVAVLPAITIPLTKGLIVTDLNVGILYVIAVSSLATIPVIMAAWGSNNKYSLLGGMRAVAQSLSYEIPLVLSVVGVIALTGSLSMVRIVEAQKDTWFILLQPLGFAVFYLAAIAEMGRIPFDMPESESELVAGFHTEYTGMKFALLLFAEYIHMVVATALIVVLFLGGWNLPFITLPPILQAAVFMVKMYIVIFILMWTRGTLPRIKINVMTAIGWKFLIPLALANIFITGILLAW
ncbi:MAG: NADH-quinone oxidoreductase subunit NuoH [Euryarchaeota archaeon]|nr:NADH-quinone oxidoreductase subunit NuoH [Euryarchaeota archaeon]